MFKDIFKLNESSTKSGSLLLSGFFLVSMIVGFLVNWSSFIISAITGILLVVSFVIRKKRKDSFNAQVASFLSKYSESYINEELGKSSTIKLEGKRIYLTDNLIVRNSKGLMFVGKYEDLAWYDYEDETDSSNNELTGCLQDKIIVSLFDKDLMEKVKETLKAKSIEIKKS